MEKNNKDQLEFNKDQLELMKFYIDRYNAIMAGQANGDEHRMFEKAEKIAREQKINLTQYMDEYMGREPIQN